MIHLLKTFSGCGIFHFNPNSDFSLPLNPLNGETSSKQVTRTVLRTEPFWGKVSNLIFKGHHKTLACSFWYKNCWNRQGSLGWAAFERIGFKTSFCFFSPLQPQALNLFPMLLCLSAHWCELVRTSNPNFEMKTKPRNFKNKHSNLWKISRI